MYNIEVHRLSADDQYRLIIGQFADNQYWPFDNRQRPIIGRLFVLVSKTAKMLLTAVHIDDSEIIIIIIKGIYIAQVRKGHKCAVESVDCRALTADLQKIDSFSAN